MSVNVRELRCSPEDVFRVLGDGWLYPGWVVGASRMREVQAAWPAQGSHLFHSFGVWPLLIDDDTVVEKVDAPRHLVIRAKGWPMGEARVTMDVKPRGDGCVVRMQEEAVAGPGALVPRFLMDILLTWRNTEALHRLAYLAEGIADRPGGTSTADGEIDVSEATE